ncbi:MAG: hypothetical protein SGI88_01740 [Candidatus Hydrogenedentes bacterium]|nr:hypothetical protein [Candidatus Hydrogenedentota bacterium]
MKLIGLAMLASCAVFIALSEERTEPFDSNPEWDGMNNRSTGEMRPVVQDFGYVAPVGSEGGQIGGMLTPDGHPAYYAKKIPEANFDTPLNASGNMTIKKGAGNFLLGFFNANTVNDWRMPNSTVFRINGRGETFHAHTEYATSKWRAGAGIVGRYDAETDRNHPIENPSDMTYRWTLVYDPAGNNGSGLITATLNDMKVVMDVSPEFRQDGAAFNRFGLMPVVKHADTGGECYIADLEINGEKIDLTSDPKWDERGNHASFFSDETRPRFNFGYSDTHYAGGKAAGEIGGLFFRGDCRYPERLAYYGAKTEPLTLEKPLRASGKVTFRRGVSDSTTLFGFFNAEHSVKVSDSQADGMPTDVLGFAIEGPSAQGFFAYPSYRTHGEGRSQGRYDNLPVIYPDGASHDWELRYEPGAAGAQGTLIFILDKNPPVVHEIPAEHIAEGATFNRFGFVTPWIDGNGQIVYLDDLTYTVRQ